MLMAYNSGAKGTASDFGSASKGGAAGFMKSDVKKIEPLSYKGLPEEQKASKAAPSDNTHSHLAKANNLLAELDREEKSGFNLGQSHDDDFDMSKYGKKSGSNKKAGGLSAMQQQLNGGNSKESNDNIGDNYDDDFDDDIEEDLPVDANDPLMDDADLNARSANVAGSGQGITVS